MERPSLAISPANHALLYGPGGAEGEELIVAELLLPDRSPIALHEAVLGAKVRVPTLDGAVELAIPAGTNSGRTFRLKGRGFPGRDGKGDLLATVRIVLPERSDAELDELMRKWRERKPYDPRKGME